MPFNKGDPSFIATLNSYLCCFLWVFCAFGTVALMLGYFAYRLLLSSSSSTSQAVPINFDTLMNEYFDVTCIFTIFLIYEFVINVVLKLQFNAGKYKSYWFARSKFIRSIFWDHFEVDLHFDTDITRAWAKEMKEKLDEKRKKKKQNNNQQEIKDDDIVVSLTYNDRVSSKVNYDPEDEVLLEQAAKEFFPLDEAAQKGEKYQKFMCSSAPHYYLGITHWTLFAMISDVMDKLIYKRGISLCIHTFESNFLLPLWGFLLSFLGFTSVSRRAIADAMKKKNSNAPTKIKTGCVSAIVPGGAPESLTSALRHDVMLKEKAGFIKVALEEDAIITPVFHFGEEKIYKQVLPESIFGKNETSPRWFSWPLLDWTGVGFPLCHGRFFLPMIPYKAKFDAVFLKPIFPRKLVEKEFGEKRKRENTPANKFSREEVAFVHKIYVEKIKEMYAFYGPIFSPEQELRLVDNCGRL